MRKKTLLKKKFVNTWNSSTQPRKQRKFRVNAPLHTLQKFLGAHLTKDLRTKHHTRSMHVITGDKVKILRGQHKGKEGKVIKVLTKKIDVQENRATLPFSGPILAQTH